MALAVSIRLNTAALASAPLVEVENSQFFRPTVNGLIVRSSSYPKFWITRFIQKNILSPIFTLTPVSTGFLFEKLGIIFYRIPNCLAISSSSSHSGNTSISFSFSITFFICSNEGLA